jgi:hypothetical protein
MDGYTLDPDELAGLKGILTGASDQLGMKDFSQKASLEGFVTTQDAGSYEGAEENTIELVQKLIQFVYEDYPRVVGGMQTFINDVHAAITDAADNAHITAKVYQEQEDRNRDRLMDAEERERRQDGLKAYAEWQRRHRDR